jgi:hypothetical protein
MARYAQYLFKNIKVILHLGHNLETVMAQEGFGCYIYIYIYHNHCPHSLNLTFCFLCLERVATKSDCAPLLQLTMALGLSLLQRIVWGSL